MGPRPVWTGAENLAPTGDSVPDHPVRSDFDCSSFDILKLANHFRRVTEVASRPESYLSSFHTIHSLHISPYHINTFISESDIIIFFFV